jgi:virginiamycin B lyase
MSDSAPQVALSKVVLEYPLPAAGQTHEMVALGDDLLLLSQQTDSSLVKVALDPATGRPRAAAKFTVDSPFAGLHGLCVSRAYPGKVWATLQFDSALVLIDPGADDVDRQPEILQRIPLPSPVRGPHGVIEHGGNLWTSCKDSSHVVRVNHREPADLSIYPCSPRPIFVAVHPTSGDVYASLDNSSRIWHLNKASGSSDEIEIPADRGKTPVGLIAGPDGNVWFVLLSGSSGGTGTFGRISGDGEITWFHLTSMLGATAGLIHLAFDPRDRTGSRLWLLGSSMASMMALNAVFSVRLGDDGARIATQTTTALATQHSMTHRILVHRGGVFVTELGISTLALLTGAALTRDDVVSETWDEYSVFGQGSPRARVTYADPFA